MIENTPIIATWGIGPSYRKRVKHHILESLKSGYAGVMKYAILTDHPEDFEEIASETGLVTSIVNIHDIRKDFEWSIDKEFIPTSLDYENYGKEYVDNLKQAKHFSYGLHRFQLIDLAEKGYTKILFMDPDMKLNYDKINIKFSEEEFWEEFNTPINSMKGCVAENVGIYNSSKFVSSRCMGTYVSSLALQICTTVLYLLDEKFKKNKFRVLDSIQLTEGPFRYYNFRTPQEVYDYFLFWEESQRIIMSHPKLLQALTCGGYMYCDYLPVICANLYSGLEVENFSNIIYDMALYYEDRYFLPRNRDATLGLPLQPGKNLDEFFEINKVTETKCKELGVWPNVDPPYIYKLKNIL